MGIHKLRKYNVVSKIKKSCKITGNFSSIECPTATSGIEIHSPTQFQYVRVLGTGSFKVVNVANGNISYPTYPETNSRYIGQIKECNPINVFVVGGGGGGGSQRGGGGGGGGVREVIGYAIDFNQDYPIVIGGGAGAGGQGGTSSGFGLTCTGGGGGGSVAASGSPGGSGGGGGGGHFAPTIGGNGNSGGYSPPEGNPGGPNGASGPFRDAGGGGSGPPIRTKFGTSYAGGGGAGPWFGQGPGGSAGANTGNGGGGAGDSSGGQGNTGGSGGPGIVIISQPLSS